MPDNVIDEARMNIRQKASAMVDDAPIVQGAHALGKQYDSLASNYASGVRDLGEGVSNFMLTPSVHVPIPSWLGTPTYGPTDPQAGWWQKMLDAIDRGQATSPPVPHTPDPPSVRSLKKAGRPRPQP